MTLPSDSATGPFWDAKYRGDGYIFGTAPNRFLVDQAAGRLRPGMRALVPGDGEGRNGVWLARQGLDVTSVDASPLGQDKARRLAAAHGVRMDFRIADLREWDWPRDAFDAVVVVSLHFRPEVRSAMHRAMLGAVRPGGWVIMEVFSPAQLDHDSGGPPVPELLVGAGELARDFADAEIELLEETVIVRTEGRFEGRTAAVTRLLARRREAAE